MHGDMNVKINETKTWKYKMVYYWSSSSRSLNSLQQISRNVTAACVCLCTELLRLDEKFLQKLTILK